jgi:hypothetical protein
MMMAAVELSGVDVMHPIWTDPIIICVYSLPNQESTWKQFPFERCLPGTNQLLLLKLRLLLHGVPPRGKTNLIISPRA